MPKASNVRDDAHHGGLVPSELEPLGIRPRDVLDLSANVNPLGPDPKVVEAIRSVDLTAYPDPEGRAARYKLAAYVGVPVDRVLLGHGATELMWSLLELAPSGRALNVEPTFSEWARAVSVRPELELERVWLGLSMDLGPLEAALQTPATWVFLGHPNNPTGRLLDVSSLRRLVDRYPQTYFVLDESFIMLSRRPEDAGLKWPENVIRLRSLTKDHALAGVRLGYAVVPSGWPERLEEVRPRWMLSAFALSAAVAAMDAWNHVEQCRRQLLTWTDEFIEQLRDRGFETYPSDTTFVLIESENAADLRTRLLRGPRPIQVRDCASFGLSHHIRVATRDPETQRRFFEGLDAL